MVKVAEAMFGVPPAPRPLPVVGGAGVVADAVGGKDGEVVSVMDQWINADVQVDANE